MNKNAYITVDTIAYHSSFAGIEIKGIEYGIEDHIIFVSGAWTGHKTVHRSKIYYTAAGRDYFIHKGVRIHLDECIRC